jgi:hypothetical protein
MLEHQLDACRRNDLERVRALVTADSTLLIRQAATGKTPPPTARARDGGMAVSWRGQPHWRRTAAVHSLDTADLLLIHRAAPRRIARTVMANTPLQAAPAANRLARPELSLNGRHGPADPDTRRVSGQVAAQ